jgi:cell wall-associated NlpC family hydrolase
MTDWRADRRLLRAAEGVAHESLRGLHPAGRFTAGTWHRLVAPLTDLCAAPGGARDRQLPLGARFCALLARDGWSFGFHQADGYCGWVETAALGPDGPVTHWVAARSSHLYPAPDIRARERMALPVLAEVAVEGVEGGFARTAAGFVPLAHLRSVEDRPRDPAAFARGLLGAPYLWGGNSAAGIDCSGLVQVAFRACGRPCPADSDLQQAMPGAEVAPGAEAPGDLIFWHGHVGMVTAPGTLLHANAHHMAVVEEPLARAEARIAAAGSAVVRRMRPA